MCNKANGLVEERTELNDLRPLRDGAPQVCVVVVRLHEPLARKATSEPEHVEAGDEAATRAAAAGRKRRAERQLERWIRL